GRPGRPRRGARHAAPTGAGKRVRGGTTPCPGTGPGPRPRMPPVLVPRSVPPTDLIAMRTIRLIPLLFAAACAAAPDAQDAPQRAAFDPSAFVIVDLTHTLDENTLYWPTDPRRFELERIAFGHTEAGYFYAANAFSAPEHGGTHLDAPIHF